MGLDTAFQPIVSLADGAVVGFEALARWPTLNNPNPVAVFAHATATERRDRLDRLCIETAIDHALRRRLPKGTLLMLNCEPLSDYVSRSTSPLLARAHDEFQVVFELTERSLLTHPHALLKKVAALRADGFSIALDDVGAHPDSLALLDIVRPDVVKLDLHLVQSQLGDDQTRILAAVLAHAERTGTVLLAEGIEDDEHLEQAVALGAALGQGYKLGRPDPLPDTSSVRWSLPPMKQSVQLDTNSPFDFVAKQVLVRTARQPTLKAFSRQMEAQAWYTVDPPMVLTSLRRAAQFTEFSRQRYSELAASSSLVAIFGRGLNSDLAPGVRGVDLDRADPLCRQWIVLVLGPHHAGALIARERCVSDSMPTGELDFDLTITYNRPLVTAVAHNLLARIH